MRSLLRCCFAVWFSLLVCTLSIAADPQKDTKQGVRIHKIETLGKGAFNNVAVVEDAVLAHTAQVFPTDEQGKVVGEKNSFNQFQQALHNLERALQAGGSSLDDVVKLNLYVASPEVVEELQKGLESISSRADSPAIALVVSPLPMDGALLAMDAVGVVKGVMKEPAGASGHDRIEVARTRVDTLSAPERATQVAVLPRGDVLYVSGQAVPGETIHAAAKATFEGLLKTLKHYELTSDSIVQFKAFVHPISKADEVQQALEEVMPKGDLPPMIFVQWEAPGSVEIELIAAAPPAKDVPAGETISFLTPPWMSSSPNFCRVTRVHGSRRVYFPGITANKAGDGAAQVHAIFQALGEAAKVVGTDYEHLAKATYYVSDDDASSQLNKLRPEYYNPKRPPAASKAAVKHVGRADRSFMMDMIAVVPEKE